MGTDSDGMLDDAKAYGNDPKRFLCVALCAAVTSDNGNSESENSECEKSVVAWARGDTKEDSEKSCRDVIARNHRRIKRLVTDWQFNVYAPGEIRCQEHAKPEALSVSPATNDDLPF